jgi:hypothetical protein
LAIEYPALGPDLVRLALAVGDRARARQVATAVADLAASNEVPWLTGTALRCQGLLESDPETLLAAVNALAQSSRPLELGLACEDAGAALAGRGRVDAGVPLLERALGIYERLEAARDLDRTQARLRGLGIRHGRRGRRTRPQLGWQSLTPTEERVVDLVAEGLTNPQNWRAAVRVAPHGADPPRPHLRQAGHLHTHPARRPSGPPASQVTAGAGVFAKVAPATARLL